MNKPKHTPGPWRQGSLSYRIEAGFTTDSFGTQSDAHDLITEVASNNPADACLIAAAPDMYFALTQIDKRLDIEKLESKSNIYLGATIHQVIKGILKQVGGNN